MKYCFLLLCIFFSLVVDALDYRVVSRGSLHVRSGAGSEFDVIGKLASKDYGPRVENGGNMGASGV